MPLDFARARQHLRSFDFDTLFIEELGWDRHSGTLEVPVEGRSFTLRPSAHKRGFAAFMCDPLPDGSIPDYPTRRKVERQVAKSAHEHLIIYTDGARTTQVWQWIKRELGKPAACREHQFHVGQPGESLLQKLQHLAVSLEEEEGITLPDVRGRAQAAFDVERVTKRFYDRFKTEHDAFMRFIQGIPDADLQRWYASVMLNRLMFIYFIQKKGFLDNDPDYLAHKLAESKARGKDRFYRDVLCPLFFEGFAKKEEERSAQAQALLGHVPYLNGGIFQRHQIEELHGQTIAIPDRAFEKLFAFFDAYHWHLDERPLRADNEINPDVLGYIFEKYINQKQMGAYYTKEDITGYISQNTIIPYLFDAAKPKCRIAFEGEQAVWHLLRADPDGYIYEPVRRGVIADDGSAIPESALPDFVQTGMRDPKARMFDKHYNLGRAEILNAQGENLALPTETWREYVERRTRCLELRRKLAAGEVRDINDLITLNLDIRRFAEDAVRSCEGPDLLNAFWQAIEGVTILDPACGSGAFLFAALNLLKPLYDACLDRMEDFIEEWGDEGRKRHPNYHRIFSQVLDNVRRHPNRDYFVLKTIIVNNLYGVDIMDEAVEICKLRLFLKLVAQVESVDRIEPLPDIDFNIRAGNSLVGYATLAEVEKTVVHDLAADKQAVARIKEQAEIADRAFQRFHEMQTEHGMDARAFSDAKAQLRDRLDKLDAELDPYLAGEYEISPHTITDKKKYADKLAAWRGSHKPFHWFVHFYGIIARGGFDVIIGNPPYVEYRRVRDEYTIRGYETAPCGNLYAYFLERSLKTARRGARLGAIVPMSSFATARMAPIAQALCSAAPRLWLSNFGVRPSKLFDGVNWRLSVVLAELSRGGAGEVLATKHRRWGNEERENLYQSLGYMPVRPFPGQAAMPKCSDQPALSVLSRLDRVRAHTIGSCVPGKRESPHFVHYQEATQYWVKAMDRLPFYEKNGVAMAPQHSRYLYLPDEGASRSLCGVINSSLFYVYFNVFADCYHLSGELVHAFPLPREAMGDAGVRALADELMRDLEARATKEEIRTSGGDTIRYALFTYTHSKPIIDRIDQALAAHYGFTGEELDFIINYDIKYRLGGEGAEGDEG